MAFNFTLLISIPGTSNGPIATTLENAVKSALGEDADGLTKKQAGELACRRFLKGLYDKEFQRVNVAAATESDRTTMDDNRASIDSLTAAIKATERILRDQADTDWA